MLYIVTLTYIFKVTKLEMYLENGETVRASEKYSRSTLIEVDIILSRYNKIKHRMEPLLMLYFVTLTKIFKVEGILYEFSIKKMRSLRMSPSDLPRLVGLVA